MRLAVLDLQRQCAHWRTAAQSFLDAESFASAESWAALEAQTGLPLRAALEREAAALNKLAAETTVAARAAGRSSGDFARAQAALQFLRHRYLQVETTLEFFGDAVATRTSPNLRSALGLMDDLAERCMSMALTPAGVKTPPALCYLKQGLGASILKAGIRLWSPGSINPVAAIKLVRHNLYRPTSLFHEAGHQVAHLLGWTESARAAIAATLADDAQLASMWTPWASEIVADVFAFLHTGYAAIPALFDVVADAETILRWPLGDPHPIGWLRTRLGCAMCRLAWGSGPWDDFETAVLEEFPLARAEETTRLLVERSVKRLPELARTCVSAPVPGLGGKPMTSVLSTTRVSPRALAELERTLGAAAWTSTHWRLEEGIRLLGLAGLREAESPDSAAQWSERVSNWMNKRPVAA
jgi:hypothetical protein